MTIRVAFSAALVLTLFAAPAPAQPVMPGSSCTGQPGVAWDLQIEVCAAIIETPEQPPRIRAVAYKNRGNAWKAKNEIDRAIADFSDAIRLDPKYADGYYNRGLAWLAKGDKDRAVADLRMAEKFGHPDAHDELRKLGEK